MLGLEDFMTIQALVKRGVYLCDIAEQLGVHPGRSDGRCSAVGRRHGVRAGAGVGSIPIGRWWISCWPRECGTRW